MNLLEQWFETARNVVTDPQGFYSTESRRDGFGYPLKFAAISIVVSSILTAISSGFRATLSAGFDPVGVVSTLVSSLVGGLIGIFLISAIVHILVYLFDGELGYKGTLAAMCYATAVYPITAAATIVPVLGAVISLIVSLYAIYIQIRGLEEFQSLTTGKAAIAVLLPYVVLTIIALIITVLMFAAIFSASQVGPAAVPVQ